MVASKGFFLLDLRNKGRMIDVTFIVRGERIQAHQVVACSHGGLLRELIETKKEEIELSDEISPNTFKTVLKYIYTDICQINDKNLFDITHCAKILRLVELEKLCADYVRSKIGVGNVGSFTSHALELDATENVKVCLEYFRKNSLPVIMSRDFPKIPRRVLAAFCESDGITCQELELFLACVEWGKNECVRTGLEISSENIRTVLGDILSKIRFPAMKQTEFLDVVLPLKILTNEEVGRVIVRCYSKAKKKSASPDESRTEAAEGSGQDQPSQKNDERSKTSPDSEKDKKPEEEGATSMGTS